VNKKVCHIITGLNNGGAEGVLFRLCAFDVSNTHIVISLMDEGKYGPLLRDAGVTVYSLNMRAGRVSLGGLIKLYKLLRLLKPDVVQTWMYHADLIGGLVAKMAGIKSIFWNVRHSTLESGKSKRSTIWVAKACAYLSSWGPNRIVYCAHSAQAVHEAIGYKVGKAVVIANGYDLTQFFPDSAAGQLARQSLNIHASELVIGMIGRFDPQKDHANLIKALGQVKASGFKFKVILVGSDMGSENQEVLAWIERANLKDNIILLGQRADIPRIMNGIDLHVLSSSFGEGFPNVLAEAMACGTPCVATDVGDSKVIIADTGWVAPPNNPKLLADCITVALDEKETNEVVWSNRKNASRKRIVDNFSIDEMIGSYQRVWNE